MISLVIVSHSAKLAQGVRELADQMVQGNVPMATAGGIDDPEQPIGTDATKVQEAIESVYSDDGVLVLMDLGSAIMSAEMALEFLPPEQRQNVRLCPAPLVEGALAAAVQASSGADLEAVYQEAMGALASKRSQMPEFTPAEAAPETEEPGNGHEIQLTIRNRLGLHARPAAKFVTTANRYEATVSVQKGSQQANAKSINQIATLGARQGDEITVRAQGADAPDVLNALQELVEANFGEDEEAMAAEPERPAPAIGDEQPPAETPDRLTGIAASPGIAIGPAALYRPQVPQVERHRVDDPESEWQALQEALEAAGADLDDLRKRMEAQGNESEAGIFMAHTLILEDPDLLDPVRSRILTERVNAAAAWHTEIEATASRYQALDDEYMRERAGDVRDVGRRVLRHLMAAAPAALDLQHPAIVLAEDLAPSDTAQLDPGQVLAICTEVGGATSHSAILARAFGIPAVVGLGPALRSVSEGQTLAVDGQAGHVWLDPGQAILDTLQERKQSWQESREVAKEKAQQPARTEDGRRIEVAANIGGPNDTRVALEFGAEGVGLFRTEFLFLGRNEPPSEAEQFDVYRRVAEAMGEWPVIIRTLDIGGDKPIPYLDREPEENPFLGWRGIRFCLDRPDLFLPQLRAILRAGHGHNLKIMFPMVTTVAEVRAAKELLEETKSALDDKGLSFDEAMEVGIMIEVPAAVAVAPSLAAEVDFFSIGTNDLTQYVMAADRGNRRVSDLADALQPAVLHMIRQSAEAAHSAGIWVGMCGELAGNVLATPLLLGLGLEELSMNAPSIPQVKAAIRNLTLERAQAIAAKALALDSAAAVAAYLREVA